MLLDKCPLCINNFIEFKIKDFQDYDIIMILKKLQGRES